MKKYLFILLFLSASLSFSQTKENDLKELYSIAIENHISKLKEFGSEDIKSLNFISNDIPQSYLPKEINGNKIHYISIYDKKNKAILKKGLRVISIQPIHLSGNRITINLIDFNVTYKNKNYDFANGGGSTSIFEYSSPDNQWRHQETKYSGI